MRVLVFPADASGCGSYRIGWPAQYLHAQGHDVKICHYGQRGIFEIVSSDGKKIDGLRYPKSVDVMVFQRVSNRIHAETFQHLRRQGVAVVMDLDDDLGKIHRDSVAYKAYKKNAVHSAENVAYAASQATLVTVTTPALLKTYAKHGRGVVIDNYICGSDLEIPRQDSATLGWGGDTRTRGDDWRVVGGAPKRLVGEGYGFHVVGPEGTLARQLSLPSEPTHTGGVPIVEWMSRLAEIGVGLAPLFPSAFNRAKSRLKVAQYAALGVPWVGSPLPEYERFHQESGTGILACNPSDWYDGLKRLLTDPVLRAEMGEAGREHMKTQTIEANAWRWWEAWTQALAMERGA